MLNRLILMGLINESNWKREEDGIYNGIYTIVYAKVVFFFN